MCLVKGVWRTESYGNKDPIYSGSRDPDWGFHLPLLLWALVLRFFGLEIVVLEDISERYQFQRSGALKRSLASKPEDLATFHMQSVE